jgi:D-alanyl-D-alanine carboxypeptidase
MKSLGSRLAATLLIASLAACATAPFEAPTLAPAPAPAACAVVVDYDTETLAKAAEEIAKLPPGSVLAGMVTDYGKARDEARVCRRP